MHPHILLADDDPEDQELLKEEISAQAPDAEVFSVWNGEQVLSYLKGLSIDTLPRVLLLDYKMPILNGVETLERLSKDPRYAGIRVVVWSTSSQREYIDRCLEKGAHRFFTKPNNPKELKNIVETLLALAYSDA
jgi:CheY-like chemotaxis protein